MIPTVLAIAGSDPSGGAGMQADLKVFSALGAYGTAVITALTAQNTQGVRAVHTLPPEFLIAQIDTLFEDVHIDSAKIGMLANTATVVAVAEALARHRPASLVLDPVMVAQSGDRLMAADAVTALRTRLLPLTDLITPNLPEAAALLGDQVARDEEEMHAQLHRLGALCPRVLLKGGHLDGPACVDLFLAEGTVTRLSADRVPTRNTHGTGCALSSAIAALRPQRDGWLSAITDAKAYLTRALRCADLLKIGLGQGPPHHFYHWWPTPVDLL
jgi:hydroxymethylpyrimidine/phosphomethylpyrimidine kinase